MSEKVGFSVADLLVISILWCFDLTNEWLTSMSHYTSQVLFPDEKFRSTYFETHEIWIFFTKCFATIVFALFIDAYNHKFTMILAVLCSCLLIPIIAVVICITKNAQAAVLLFWSRSAIYVISPAVYCLIFNQNLLPIRKTVRRLVGSFQIVETLIGKYLIFLCIPKTAIGTDYEQFVLIVDWVIITPLLITLITLVESIKKLVAGDFMKEKGFRRIMQGINNDIRVQPPKRNGKSALHVMFFVLLLVPAFTLTALEASLGSPNPGDEAPDLNPTLKHIMYAAQIMVIPLVELIISLLPMIKESVSEILCLGTAHVANIAVLILLISRMDREPEVRGILSSNFLAERQAPARKGLICDDKGCEIFPVFPGKFSFLIINPSTFTITMKNDPPIFIKEGTGKTSFYRIGRVSLPAKQTNVTVKFSLTVEGTTTTPKPTLEKEIVIFEKKHYFIIITANSTHIKWIDIEFPEKYPPEVRFYPQLTFLNTFTDEVIDGIPVQSYFEYRINSSENEFEEQYPFPAVGRYDIVKLPIGTVQISFTYMGPSEHLAKLFGTDTIITTTEPYGLYLVIVGRKKNMFLYFLKIIATQKVTTTTMKIIPDKEPDAVEKSSYAVLGATLGVTNVGYTHFLWVESPVRLRTFVIAGFKVLNSLAGWVTEWCVGDTLTRPKAITLLILQMTTAIWHIVLSWIFETRIKQETSSIARN